MRRPLPTLAFVVLVSVTPQLADGKPVAIPVVKTWGEFADQPPIDLGNGTKIRLGVEANECAVGGAVALYCLTEGYVPAGSWEGRDRFGPVRAKIARVGAKSVEALAVFCGASHEGPARGRFLFVQEVPMTATHPLRVEILSEKEKTLLAEATIQPSKQPFHTWTVFGREERIKISGDHPNRSVSASVVPLPVGRAVPRFQPMHPILFDGWLGKRRVKRSKREPLPSVACANLEDTLRLTTSGKNNSRVLRVRSGVPLVLSNPERQILARWWINGEPYIAKQSREQLADQGGQVITGKELNLRLRMDEKAFGAKSGDRIALQLLYVPMGWRWVADVESL